MVSSVWTLTFFLAIVLTLFGGIVVCRRVAVIPVIKAIGEGSTYPGETVSFLVIVEVFTAVSPRITFLESSKGNS